MGRALYPIAKLDRVQIAAQTRQGKLPPIPGFQTLKDHFIRAQTVLSMFSRVRQCQNPRSGTQIFLQYRPLRPWLPPAKLTIIGDDLTGLERPELERVVEAFADYRLLLVEVALDFPAGSGVNAGFLRRHGRFGRSRFNENYRFPRSLRWGSRKSSKLIRAYTKPAVRGFRVELELHSAWLRERNIQQLADLGRLPSLLYPHHIEFLGPSAQVDQVNKRVYAALRRWASGWR